MRRLIGTKELPKDEWLRIRKQGICGTDAGAIVGLNLYRSAFDVWMDKRTEEIDDTDNEAMRQGRDLEEYVARRFCEETGKKVRNMNYICQNDAHPYMLADFDRMVVGENAGLECKTVSPYVAGKWDNDELPPHYMMQVQHYLAVSGCDRWYVAALVLGKDFIIRVIERDEEMISNLITIEERFWNENVLKGIMPNPDGTRSCSERIAEMYAKSDRSKTVQLNGYDGLLDRRSELEGLIKKMESEKDAIDQKIKLEMEDSAYGETEHYRVSWICTESRRLDTGKLREEQPDIYDRYSTSSSCRRFLVKPAA